MSNPNCPICGRKMTQTGFEPDTSEWEYRCLATPEEHHISELETANAQQVQRIAELEASKDAWKDLAEKYKDTTLFRCFHCGNLFTEGFEAQLHFGPRDGSSSPTACLLESSRDKDNKIRILTNDLREARTASASKDTQILALREAIDVLIIGACAVAVPHAGERAVLQEAVDMARKNLADTAASAQAADQSIREDERRQAWERANSIVGAEWRNSSSLRAAILSDRAEPEKEQS